MEVVICGSVRTPIGQFLGELSDVPTVELGAQCVRETLRRSGASPDNIDEVIIGHVLAAGQGQNPARQVAISAGLPESVPAGQVSILCGSGMRAIVDGTRAIKSRDAKLIICGGMESMSRAAHVQYLRSLKKMGPLKFSEENYKNVKLNDSMMTDGLMCSLTNQHMGNTAEHVALKFEITRREQDDFAYSSVQKALIAKEKGLFDEEIVPIKRSGKEDLWVDEGPTKYSRPDYDTFQPVFKKDGTVTKGNACGLNDGASTLLVAERSKATELGLNIEAVIVGSAIAGCDPNHMGLGPIFAIRKLLETSCKWNLEDVDLFELNEAFASQSLACAKELGVPSEKVNVNGGSIALGHPIGASGCRIVTTLISALRQREKSKGIAALCIGGGMGIALAVQLV